MIISQLNMHYSDYLDKYSDANDDNTRLVLITNHQKNKPLNEREPINKEIISRAKNKFNTLIIETHTLLKLFEKKIKGEITTESCVKLLDEVGLLQEKDF